MKEEHNFTTPRNLFEKLLRDSDKFDNEPNGDNFFNFVATAYHLKNWIKKSPIASHETTKRLLKKISHNPVMKKCCDFIDGDVTYIFEKDDSSGEISLKINDEVFNPFEVKNEVLDLYREYFEIK